MAAGVALAFVLVRIARRRGPVGARRPYALGLLVAALVYVVFALAGAATGPWLALELVGVVLFGAAAWVGVRRWPLVLALGWGTHVAWDVLLHINGAGAAYTPTWYPWLCVSFDLVIAGAVGASLWSPTPVASRPAA